MSEEEIALIDTEPSITDEKAVEILKKYMSNKPSIGEEKANTVKVISSNLVWKEDDEDKIHLAWWTDSWIQVLQRTIPILLQYGLTHIQEKCCGLIIPETKFEDF
jgi:hypothetical protein